MKNRFRQNLLVALVTVLSVFTFGTLTVDASIKESTNPNSGYDTIEDGTIVIGVTKFSADTVLTARRSSTATMNDIAYNMNNGVYGGVKIYYYLAGFWFELDDNNQPTLLNDSSLNEMNIFYINNVEKTITINYSGATNNISFKTDKANKDRDVKFANGVITVPATVRELTVLNNNAPVATFAKGSESAEVFIENPNMGTIQSRDTLTYLINGNAITFQGNIPYRITKSENTPNGNLISVAIIANRIPTNKEDTKILVKDAHNPNGTLYDWGANNDDLMRQLDIMFSSEMRDATIEVTWEEGNTQTFTVSVTDVSTFEDIPAGTIDWDYETGKEGDNQFNVYADPTDPSILLFTSEIKYYADGELSGLNAGNRVGVAITPDAKYATSHSSVTFEVTGNAEDDNAQPAWGTMDGEAAVIYTPKVTDDTRVITVKVTWEEGFTQEFTIDATGAVLLSSN